MASRVGIVPAVSHQSARDSNWREPLASLLNGVAVWIFAGICIFLIIPPAYWLIYNLRVSGSTGNVEVFGIMVSGFWWAYFPVLIGAGLTCFILGARAMADALRGFLLLKRARPGSVDTPWQAGDTRDGPREPR